MTQSAILKKLKKWGLKCPLQKTICVIKSNIACMDNLEVLNDFGVGISDQLIVEIGAIESQQLRENFVKDEIKEAWL